MKRVDHQFVHVFTQRCLRIFLKKKLGTPVQEKNV